MYQIHMDWLFVDTPMETVFIFLDVIVIGWIFQILGIKALMTHKIKRIMNIKVNSKSGSLCKIVAIS